MIQSLLAHTAVLSAVGLITDVHVVLIRSEGARGGSNQGLYPGCKLLCLVHLILHISPHHSHHLRSHHLSLPLPFTPDLKLILQILSSIVALIPSGLPSWILTFTELKRHWRLFVLVSGYVC